MGWSIGYSKKHDRFIGYGVPSYCEHPECKTLIDRGLDYICGSSIGGGELGCGMFFCHEHLEKAEIQAKPGWVQVCDRCINCEGDYELKPEHPQWINHVLNDDSWKQWRDENSSKVKAFSKLQKASS